MTARSWPWPGDSQIGKLKRIIDSYRTALDSMAPATCRLVDARMTECGEGWVCGDSVDTDRLVTARTAAEEFGLSPVRIHEWAREHPGKLPNRGDGKVLYRLGDILRYHVLEQ